MKQLPGVLSKWAGARWLIIGMLVGYLASSAKDHWFSRQTVRRHPVVMSAKDSSGTIHYSIDGRPLGGGQEGFMNLLDELAMVPRGSCLTFKMPVSVCLEMNQYSYDFMLPFDLTEQSRRDAKKFETLMEIKGFVSDRKLFGLHEP